MNRCSARFGRAARRSAVVAIVAVSLLEPARMAGAQSATDDTRSTTSVAVAVAVDAMPAAGAGVLDARFTVVPGAVRRSMTAHARAHPARPAAATVRPSDTDTDTDTVAPTRPGAKTVPQAMRRTSPLRVFADPSIDPIQTGFRQAQTGWMPASPSLAVGGGFVVAAANAAFDFWRMDGARVRSGDPIDLADWFQPVLDTVPPEFEMNATDPQVLRDPTTGRFVVAATAWPKDDALHWPVVVLSASATADPNGQWCSHFIAVGHDEDGTNNAVFERMSMAMTRRGLVLLTNLIAHQGNHEFRFANARIHVLPAAQLFGSSCVAVELEERDLIEEANFSRYDRAELAQVMPVGDHAYAVGSRSLGGEELRIWPIAVAADGTIGEVLSADVEVDAYDVPPDAAQQGTDVLLFTGGAEVRSAAVRGDDLWAVQSVDVGDRSGIGWHRIDVTDLADREEDRFTVGNGDDVGYPAILPAPECDNAYVVYSIAAADRFASVGLADINGDTVHTVVDGEGCIANRGANPAAWGARSALALDEATGTVWGHVGYAAGTSADCAENGWETALFGVDWDICDTAGPEPTPPPTGDSKGIGFALASKRFMRGVYSGGGLTARRGAMNGSALTGLQVQNIDGQLMAQPRLNFGEQRLPYEAPGRTLFSRTADMRTIAPGASLNAYVPSLDLPDAMFRVTIATPRDGGDLSAILRTDWDSGGAAVVSNLWFSSRTVIPHVTRNHQSHTTVLALSNAESQPVAVTLRFFRSGSATEVAAKQIDLDPAEALTFDLNDNDATFRSLGDGFRGTAIVEAAGGIVGAQVYEYVESSALAIGGYEGIPADQGSSRLFVPLFRSQQYGPGGIRLNTAIAVANAGAQEASVTVTYRPTTNASASEACRAAGTVRHGPVRIPANSNFVFNQGPGGGHGLPENCFGSAVVETASSGDRIVGTVLDTQNADEQLSMINASPVEFAATKIALPLFRSRHLVAAYTTGIQVMNTSDRSANVHIDFARSEGDTTFPIGGCRGQCDAIIRPFEAYTWWPPAVAAIPAGTYGAAVISSDQPIVVLVNDYPLAGNSDMATYAGIPVLTQP